MSKPKSTTAKLTRALALLIRKPLAKQGIVLRFNSPQNTITLSPCQPTNAPPRSESGGG